MQDLSEFEWNLFQMYNNGNQFLDKAHFRGDLIFPKLPGLYIRGGHMSNIFEIQNVGN